MRSLPDMHMRKRRVPSDIDVPLEQLLNLPLVVREQCKVKQHALLMKVFADALPDRHDFGIVSNRAKKNGIVVTHLVKTTDLECGGPAPRCISEPQSFPKAAPGRRTPK